MVRLSPLLILLLCSCSPSQRDDFASPAVQARREKSLRLVSEYVDRIERHNLVVTQKWDSLDFRDKELIAAGAAQFLFRVPDGETLRFGELMLIKDARTMKSIGRYSQHGLELY